MMSNWRRNVRNWNALLSKYFLHLHFFFICFFYHEYSSSISSLIWYTAKCVIFLLRVIYPLAIEFINSLEKISFALGYKIAPYPVNTVVWAQPSSGSSEDTQPTWWPGYVTETHDSDHVTVAFIDRNVTEKIPTERVTGLTCDKLVQLLVRKNLLLSKLYREMKYSLSQDLLSLFFQELCIVRYNTPSWFLCLPILRGGI